MHQVCIVAALVPRGPIIPCGSTLALPIRPRATQRMHPDVCLCFLALTQVSEVVAFYRAFSLVFRSNVLFVSLLFSPLSMEGRSEILE